MTFAQTTPLQLYQNVASIWRDSGASADPLDLIEVILEMFVIARRRAGVKSALEIDQGELTPSIWRTLRAELDQELELPASDRGHHSFAESTPGLLEKTRRAVAEAISSKPEVIDSEYARALLRFLVHAPQTGLRRSALGYFAWPDYLAPLLTALMGKPSEQPVYCPFDSSGWMPLLLADAGWSVDCELANSQAARILLLFASLGDCKLKAHVNDPIRQPSWLDGEKLRQFAHSAAITSFGLRLGSDFTNEPYERFPVRFHYGEGNQIAHVIAQTKGRALIIVPESFLFRTAGGERDYKEQLVRRGMLTAVIRLPRDVFAPYANVQSSLLIFETLGRNNSDVLFIDASDDLGVKARKKGEPANGALQQIKSIVDARRVTSISKVATYEEIAAQEFNISVDRYIRDEIEQKIENALDSAKTAELIDVAEIIRPQAVPSVGETGREHTLLEVSLQDIQPDGSIRTPSKQIQVDDSALGKVMRQKLEPGDVLLSVRGRIGAVGIVPEFSGPGWLASQAFVILRLRKSSNLSPLILYRYLASPLGQGLMQSLATSATVPMISMGDVRKIRVMIPTIEEQREIERQYDKVLKLRSQIKQLEKLADDLNEASWPMTKISVTTRDKNVG
jgi:type I restriction enzyme M protein